MRDVREYNSEELDCHQLHNACIEGHDLAKLLIKEKSTIGANAVCKSGSSPLMYAAKNGLFRLVERLLNQGADRTHTNGDMSYYIPRHRIRMSL